MKVPLAKEFPEIPKLKLAVVGHVEWVSFVSVKELPTHGSINHALDFLEEPAGGGAVAAVKLSQISGVTVDFFTALGNDSIGKKCYERLSELGLNVSASWKDKPTRKGISLVDKKGDRAITIIGERLQPNSNDNLPWEILNEYDGVFTTATDLKGLILCRKAKILTGTPRIDIEIIKQSNIQLDALIGSGLDSGEKFSKSNFKVLPKLIIKTKGEKGCDAWPLGEFESYKIKDNVVDSYGCGDSFAAGVTLGLAAGFDIKTCISLGSLCGAQNTQYLGPYEDSLSIKNQTKIGL
mgnify:CR=1 FL=1